MQGAVSVAGPVVFGIPLPLVLFGLVLIGVVVSHQWPLQIVLAGLVVILAVRVAFSSFDLVAHLAGEWPKIVNLFGMLVGFALLAEHFEASRLPKILPRVLPAGARGCFALLALVWLLSGVLDNIAAALAGATAAAGMFERRVHLGYLAAIVAAANAGGAGSVLGDTTTTMMWIDGISPLAVMPAYFGSVAALVVFGVVASRQQARHAPIVQQTGIAQSIDGASLAIVIAVLIIVAGTNAVAAVTLGAGAGRFPFLAVALWATLLAFHRLRPIRWSVVRGSLRGSLLLVTLVFCASLMPVDSLPTPTWTTTLALGFVSAIFDNIPLVKLALDQRGYDAALLAYSVGLGGSMVWFGSSAGIAVTGMFPEAQSVRKWLRQGWHVPVAFIVGFFILYGVHGWNP